MDKFPGFNGQIDKKVWTELVQIPEQVYSLDGKRFIPVSLVQMTLPSDDRGECKTSLNKKMASFSPMARSAAIFIILQALDGQRKSSTVMRWINELSLFSRTISEAMNDQLIHVITLKMYLWYCSRKNPSQEKLLRSTLLWWIKEGVPGVHQELVDHLGITPPRKPRGMIEVQNADSSERPLTMQQVHGLLDDIAELYLSNRFNPQDNLLWRLMVSEAMRPAQMRLMQFKDIDVVRHEAGRLVADLMREVTQASEEQTSGIAQINQAMGQMDQVTQGNAALVEEAASAAESLAAQAHALVRLVSVFRLDPSARS